VRHLSIPFTDYAKLGFPGADDLANMFQYKYEFGEEYCAQRPVAMSRELHPGSMSFLDWVGRYGHALRTGVGAPS